MKNIIFIFFIATFVAQAQPNLTLDSAIKIGLENNYSILLSKKNYEIADNNAAPGNAGMLPKIDLRAGYNYSIQDTKSELAGQPRPNETDNAVSKVLNYGADLGWTLFDGLGMFIAYDRLHELRDKSAIELQITMENMIRNLAATYYDVVRLGQDMKIAEENIAITRDRYTRAENRAEFGAGTSLELLRSKVDLNVDSTVYLQTEIAYRNMRRALNFTMGREVTTDFTLDTNINLGELLQFENLETQTMQANSSIMNALKSKEISDLDHDLVLASMWPRIQGTASYSYNKNESDGGFLLLNQTNGFSFGLNASVNVFNGLQTQIRRQNALVRKEMSDIIYNQIKSSIELSLRNTYETYRRRIDIYNMQRENLEAAQLNFERTNELFGLGRQTSIELRDAQINLLNAKQRINAALYNIKVSETELRLLSGRLI